MRNLSLAQSVVAHCIEAGSLHAVVSPGSRNTPVVLALHEAAKAKRLTIHVVLDERSAAFLALGLCRASFSPVILSCTSGSAGAHYLPALAEARELGLPLVAITADRPVELQGRGAPQTMPQETLFGDLVRTSVTLEPGQPLPNLMKQAQGPQRGPVHYNLRFRKPLWGDFEWPEWPECAPDVPERTAPSSAFRRAVAGARRGLIVVGPRERSPDGRGETALIRFAEQAGWPVLSEPASDVCSPLVPFGAEAFLRREQPPGEPDLILRVGRSPTAGPTSKFLKRWGAGKTWLIEPSGRLLDGECIDPFVEECSVEAALEGLSTAPAEPGWLEAWLEAGRLARASFEAGSPDTLWAGTVVRAVWSALSSSDDLHVASSMAIRNLCSFAELGQEGPCVSANRGLNGIDGTIACAVGQARCSSRPMTVMLGDLAFLHDQASLALVGAANLRIVVLDNGGGAIFEHLPIAGQTEVFERYFLTPQDADIGAIARAHGLAVDRIGKVSELESALEKPGPRVLHVVMDRGQDFAMHQAYWSAVRGE
ncbi:MAG: 2-succinyl-5-enolpyruvyl-6-hydroxy-3-cyclohexene-1-carboxylic-acid synthase [Myxococcota bacterium]|nr:2-succinyl-5-enolpyruvyl-6-hydroxy-3-cyclohexene-1-carboxylic-acid synthase [Myxococcota bacterium]